MKLSKLVLLIIVTTIILNAQNTSLLSQWHNSQEFKLYEQALEREDINSAIKIRNAKAHSITTIALKNYKSFIREKYKDKIIKRVQDNLSLSSIDILIKLHKKGAKILKDKSIKGKHRFVRNLYDFVKRYNDNDTNKIAFYEYRLIKHNNFDFSFELDVHKYTKEIILKYPSIDLINSHYYSEYEYKHQIINDIIQDLYYNKYICKEAQHPAGGVKIGEKFCYNKYILIKYKIKKYYNIYKNNPTEESINYILAVLYSLTYNEEKATEFYQNLLSLKQANKLKKDVNNTYYIENVFRNKTYDYYIINAFANYITTLSTFYKYGLFSQIYLNDKMLSVFPYYIIKIRKIVGHGSIVQQAIISRLVNDYKAGIYNNDILKFFLDPKKFAIRGSIFIDSYINIIEHNCKLFDCTELKAMHSLFPDLDKDYYKKNISPINKFKKKIYVYKTSSFLQASQPITLAISDLVKNTIQEKDGKVFFDSHGYNKYKNKLQIAINNAKNILPMIKVKLHNNLIKKYIIHAQSHLSSTGAMTYMHNANDCWNNNKMELLEKKFCADKNIKIALKYLKSDDILKYQRDGLKNILEEVNKNYPKDIDFNKLIKLKDEEFKLAENSKNLQKEIHSKKKESQNLQNSIRKKLDEQEQWKNWLKSKQNELELLKKRVRDLDSQLGSLRSRNKFFKNKMTNLSNESNNRIKNYAKELKSQTMYMCTRSDGSVIKTNKKDGSLCLEIHYD